MFADYIRNKLQVSNKIQWTCMWYYLVTKFWPATKVSFNERKPENKSLLRQKNFKDIVIKNKGTRMGKDGEDYHRL